jgi:hypothetical protein
MRGVLATLAAISLFLLGAMSVGNAWPLLADLTSGASRQAALAGPGLIARPFGLPRIADLPLSSERACLALAIYHEARGEVRSGQIAVARVVINRSRSRAYPSTVCGVVFQNAHMLNRCQFSFACDRLSDFPSDHASWKNSIRVANGLICAGDCTPPRLRRAPMATPLLRTATHYHATHVAPSWSKKLTPLGRIGGHLFYASNRVLRQSY